MPPPPQAPPVAAPLSPPTTPRPSRLSVAELECRQPLHQQHQRGVAGCRVKDDCPSLELHTARAFQRLLGGRVGVEGSVQHGGRAGTCRRHSAADAASLPVAAHALAVVKVTQRPNRASRQHGDGRRQQLTCCISRRPMPHRRLKKRHTCSCSSLANLMRRSSQISCGTAGRGQAHGSSVSRAAEVALDGCTGSSWGLGRGAHLEQGQAMEEQVQHRPHKAVCAREQGGQRQRLGSRRMCTGHHGKGVHARMAALKHGRRGRLHHAAGRRRWTCPARVGSTAGSLLCRV